MGAAWISAFGALGGVAIGTISAVVAARIQARPAHKAAEAAQAQAEAAYRAALDSAREQIKGAAAQNTGSARRQVYGAFISEAHKLQLAVAAVEQNFYEATLDVSEARRILDLIDKAAALVFLEGPEEVTEAAWEVYNEGLAGLHDYENSEAVRSSWGAIVEAGQEETLRLPLDRVRQNMGQVHGIWTPTAKNWALQIGENQATPFPQIPTHIGFGEHIVPYNPAAESHRGPIGAGRLVQSPNGGDLVPFYDTVRPTSESIVCLHASIENYLAACRPLIEGSTVTAEQAHSMLQYALNARHGSTPKWEFLSTAGDVGNDLLQFVEKAQKVLNPE
ncbi:hypothetical protein SNS2_1551 [Streptomyces netropsis]|nr:hypothetical protein SNS2_1551 [Streptomyces netropsis]